MPGNLPLSHGKRPPSTITPPMAVPWPQMNLVAGCPTLSAAHSSGRPREGRGEAGVAVRGGPGRAPAAGVDAGGALLEHRHRRIHDARVDVAEALQGEEIGGVIGVL